MNPTKRTSFIRSVESFPAALSPGGGEKIRQLFVARVIHKRQNFIACREGCNPSRQDDLSVAYDSSDNAVLIQGKIFYGDIDGTGSQGDFLFQQ